MASYKVAQDVEAEDKLLGPFSFRQFVYLMIAAMAGVMAWGLSRVFLPLAIIPAPVVIFFVVLALPLRKDQPMEIYLAAIVSFYLKPRKRLWQPDGIESMIEITTPKVEESHLTKDISGNEAERRLAYLATLADTHGWSIRNATSPEPASSMVGDVYHEAQSYQNEFDDDSSVAQKFDSMIDRADSQRRQDLMIRLSQPAAPAIQPQPIVSSPPPTAANPTSPSGDYTFPTTTPTSSQASPGPAAEATAPRFDPYPTNMRQHVIDPNGHRTPASQPPQTTAATQQPAPVTQEPSNSPTTTSDTAVLPDIISLANNNDLSIETIAREAHRIEQKHKREEDEQEVVISLR